VVVGLIKVSNNIYYCRRIWSTSTTLRRSRSALSVSTQGREVISGVCTSIGGFSPGVTIWGVISGGLISRGYLRHSKQSIQCHMSSVSRLRTCGKVYFYRRAATVYQGVEQKPASVTIISRRVGTTFALLTCGG